MPSLPPTPHPHISSRIWATAQKNLKIIFIFKRKYYALFFESISNTFKRIQSLPNAVRYCPVLQLYTYHQSLQHTPKINFSIRSQTFLIVFQKSTAFPILQILTETEATLPFSHETKDLYTFHKNEARTSAQSYLFQEEGPFCS